VTAIEDYTVRLEEFQGPLDLLLYLARRSEVDLVNLPIARITDQFIASLGDLDRVDIDRAGEFLVMAATLMEIKSRLVSPRPVADPDSAEDDADADRPAPSDEGDDLRDGLVRQLLAYKANRDAADALEARAREWSRRHPAAAVGADRDALLDAAQRRADSVELEDLGLYDLARAYEAVVERVNFDLIGAHSVTLDDDDTPIEEHAADLVDRLASAPQPMRALLAGRPRGQVVGLFVAALELVRRGRVGLDVRPDDGEVVLSLRPVEDAAEPGVSGG